jgi:hypothetical protein
VVHTSMDMKWVVAVLHTLAACHMSSCSREAPRKGADSELGSLADSAADVEAALHGDALLDAGDTACSEDGQCAPDSPCEGLECGTGRNGALCGQCPCPHCRPYQVTCTMGLCIGDPSYACSGSGCHETWDCVNGCGTEDQECQSQCMDDAPLEALIAFNDLSTCIKQHVTPCRALCPAHSEDYRDCPPDAVACFERGNAACQMATAECIHGDHPCADTWSCFLDCAPDDQGCAHSCSSCGDVQAQYLWFDIYGCLGSTGYRSCTTGNKECVGAALAQCESPIQECAGDTGR